MIVRVTALTILILTGFATNWRFLAAWIWMRVILAQQQLITTIPAYIQRANTWIAAVHAWSMKMKMAFVTHWRSTDATSNLRATMTI